MVDIKVLYLLAGPAFIISFTFALPLYLLIERPFLLKPEVLQGRRAPIHT
jgi:hypothetical protein